MGSKAVVMKWSKQIKTSHVEQLIREEKDLQKARKIFDSATAEYSNGFRHDETTFGLMISRLASANLFRPAEELLDRMKEEKCDIHENLFISICRAFGRVHRPLDVVRVFQKMNEFKCELTEKSYVTVFSILVAENQLPLALRFYCYMKKMGIPPSVVSLNILIKALCQNSGTMDAAFRIFRDMPNHGCTPDLYTYGTLIAGLCKFGRIDEANQLFREMETRGCLPTVIIYTSLINGLCKTELIVEALEIFKDMRDRGVEPNVFTYTSLMDGLCKNGHSSQAMELLNMMVSRRLSPNMITYSTLINGLCKEGKLREALELFDKMKLQRLKPDAGLYWKIISVLCECNRFQEATNFIDEMVLAGVSPNRLTWGLHVKIHNTVLQGLCTECDPSRAFNLYLSMRTRGVSVEHEAFNSLVKLSCTKDLQKAGDIIDEMVLAGCTPDKDTWEAILSGPWEWRKALQAAESLRVQLIQDANESIIST